MPPDRRIGVGVAAVAWRDTDEPDPVEYGRFKVEVLLGKRKGSHGAGLWSTPGGWMEFGETFTAAALRELDEETGLKPSPLRPIRDPGAVHTSQLDGQQFVTIYIAVPLEVGAIPKLREPAKCAGWEWFPWNRIPPPEACFPNLWEGVYGTMSQILIAEGKRR